MSSSCCKWSWFIVCFEFVCLTYMSFTFSSTGATNQIIIRRGHIQKSYAHDIFSYTDDEICKKEIDISTWCGHKDSFQQSGLNHDCSCQCFHDYKTFFPRGERCVDIYYLQDRDGFGIGQYEFDLQADFGGNDSIQLPVFDSISDGLWDSEVDCNNCKINNTMYFEKDQWREFNFKSISITIDKYCSLSWTAGSAELEGKILKIQFKECDENSISLVFLKSKGSYTIDLPSKSSYTVAPAISSSLNPIHSTISSSSSFTPTPVLQTSAVLPSSSSVAVLLPTARQPPTKAKHGLDQASSSTGAIVGAVVGCIVVIGIVVVVVVVVLRRCKHGNSRSHNNNGISPKSSMPKDAVDNPVYGKKGSEVIGLKAKPKPRSHQQEQSDVKNEDYDYAAVDGVEVHTTTNNQPVYQSLDRKNVPPKENSSRNSDADREQYSYNHLQHPTHKPPHSKDVPSDSVYQPLEKPSTGNGADREQYSYNHLQHPTHEPPHSKDVPSDPVYQPLQKPSTGNGAGREQYSYSHLQHCSYNPPHSKDVPSDPVYQPLQRSSGTDDYLEAGTCIDSNQIGASEPVYNVLEGPDPKQHPQDNDPEYNVLEDPNANQHQQDNDPVYNVLEDPNANHAPRDEPLYDVLEDPDGDYDNAPIEDDQNLPVSGQDNIAYSSTVDLNIPQSPRPSSPDYHVLEGLEGSLPDSTYEPLDVLTRDDVYEPLDRTAQSIYQSLGPTDSTA